MKKSKDLIILRGISGSGKSTFAKLLGKAICSADDYFVSINGEYLWKEEDLGKAHRWCTKKSEMFMERNISPIIISNTCVKARDLKPYTKLAEKYGYRVFSVIVENRHNGINTHNVPEEVLNQQRQKFNIKL